MAGMTIKQIQNLLQFLGYYEGIPDDEYGPLTYQATLAFQIAYKGLEQDGIPGEQTQKALRDAVAYGMPTREVQEEPEGGDWWENIEFFAREEFRCKCGGKHCEGYPAEMKQTVVQIADAARKHFGKPAHVVSGLRCQIHNANCGGVANSQHMYGEAVDLRIDGVTADQLLAYMKQQPEVRYAYKINDRNVHFDIPKGER